MHDWAVPLTVACATFAAIFGVAHLVPAAPLPPPPVPVFEHLVVDPSAPGSLVAMHVAPGKPGWTEVVPVTREGAVLAQGQQVASAVPASAGPRFAASGSDAVLTIYAFTKEGRLLGTTDAPAEAARFPLDGDFQALPHVALHLADGPAPNGTVALPRAVASLAPMLRDALAGQPEGGVVAMRVEAGPVAELEGPLLLAVRIDRLLPAGPAATVES